MPNILGLAAAFAVFVAIAAVIPLLLAPAILALATAQHLRARRSRATAAHDATARADVHDLPALHPESSRFSTQVQLAV
ncbi:hypothetical protein [Luteococcus sp. OSA5]|uniref:hypothetical protein n=1 Tax=Luteococcus sp. OSA5 TaxID=3401630 RepID=UPI003B437AC0